MQGSNLISIVDDDDAVRVGLERLMNSLGFRVETFPSAVDFLSSPHLHETSCLIADVHMPHMTGTELHDKLMGSGRTIPTILITAYADNVAKARALGAGVIGYLSKPLDDGELLVCINVAFERNKPTGAP